jgi:hypothetical protein
MRAALLLFGALLAVAALERDDLLVLRTAHADLGGDAAAARGVPWEHALELARDAERTETALSDATTALFAAVLADDVQYVFHGRGECVGVAQVAACLVAEEEQRVAGRGDARGGRARQVSTVRQGALQVVRVLDVPAAQRGTRLLDVYFVHLDGDGRAAFVEHLPTVHDPIRFSWRGSAAAPTAAAASADSPAPPSTSPRLQKTAGQ